MMRMMLGRLAAPNDVEMARRIRMRFFMSRLDSLYLDLGAEEASIFIEFREAEAEDEVVLIW